MTCGEMFKSRLNMFIPMILDHSSVIFSSLTVMMILICFFGKEGKLTRKSIYPLAFLCVVLVVPGVLVVLYQYVTLRKTWNEPYQDGMLLIQYPGIPIWFGRFMVYVCVFLSAMFTFSKKRIRTAILSLVMNLVLIGYVTLETTYSISFFARILKRLQQVSFIYGILQFLIRPDFLGCGSHCNSNLQIFIIRHIKAEPVILKVNM